MKYSDQKLNEIIENLKELTPGIETLPYETFCGIWKNLNITDYSNILRIRKKIPELVPYIESCVTEISFDYRGSSLYPEIISDYHGNNLKDIYPGLKYVDDVNLQLNDKNIYLAYNIEYFRNIEIEYISNIGDDIETAYDIMINIIKRNVGKVMIGLLVTSKRYNVHDIEYDNGIIRAKENYLFDKIVSMRPEGLVFYSSNYTSMLRLATIPTIKKLYLDIRINEETEHDPETGDYILPNLYFVLKTLLYIDVNTEESQIENIYTQVSNMIMTNVPKYKNKIIAVNYTYENVDREDVILFSQLFYWDPLSLVGAITDTSANIFPNLEIMTLPVDSQDVVGWLIVAPNIKYFNSKEKFFVKFLGERKKKLIQALNECDISIDQYIDEYNQIPDLGVAYV
jgi:hypothetical protein